MCVIVDCDCDGYTSAAIFINYLYDIFPEYVESNLIYIHHEGKQHGLADTIALIPEDIELVICPDSASNDYEQHKILFDRGIACVVLDHHEADKISEHAIIVNNQLCDYPNKHLSGAGIVWHFCNAFNDIFDLNGNCSLDLCALGNCGDMMDYREIEIRGLVRSGFFQISNPFFAMMVNKNKFSIDKMGGINYLSIAFYVVPFINAITRSGTIEEKDLIFKSMCIPYAYERIESGKRGHKGEMVPLYDEAVRIAGNVKNRQTKLQNESMSILEQKIKSESLLENSVLILTCEPGEVEKQIAGLCANKIQNKYQRPTLVLIKSKTKDDSEYYYRGSMRNYSMSEIEDFKGVLESTNLTEYVQGHAGAAGCSIAESNLDDITASLNKIYENYSLEPVYWVDYVLDENECDPDFILSIAQCQDYYGQNVQESKVILKDIDLSKCGIKLCGKNMDTIRMVLPNGLVVCIFKQGQEEYDEMLKLNTHMTAVCTPKVNEWAGEISGEVIVETYELDEKWVF